MTTNTNEFTVTGMSCEHCENAVRGEVGQIEGVRVIEVSAITGKLVIATDKPVEDQQIIDAVDEAGYQAARA